jgi:hypothetical protein
MRVALRPSQVAPGAVLDIEGTPHPVIGSLSFDYGGACWGEHYIQSTPGPGEWLSISPRGDLKVVLWTPRYDLFGEPDPVGMTMDGREWTLLEAGTATYTAEGDTGTGPRGTCDFVEFSDADGLLVFESFDGAVWEISVGRLLDPSTVRSYREVAGD